MKALTISYCSLLCVLWLSSPGKVIAQKQTLPSEETQTTKLSSSTNSAVVKTAGVDAASTNPSLSVEHVHHFWDRENIWLFAGVGASRALDYSSTLNMRRRGRQEIFLNNETVDNHPAFAVIEAAATGVSIGVSGLFHHYDHHKLERWTSFVHMGLTTTGAVRNYCLKTVHPVSPASKLSFDRLSP